MIARGAHPTIELLFALTADGAPVLSGYLPETPEARTSGFWQAADVSNCEGFRMPAHAHGFGPG